VFVPVDVGHGWQHHVALGVENDKVEEDKAANWVA
jgi:hypothetical protein